MVVERTWTAIDECDNLASCTQVITFDDTTPPVFTAVPLPVEFDCETDLNAALTGLEPVSTDNCGSTLQSFQDVVIGSGNCPRTIHRIWTAIDECGNTAAFTHQITLIDTIPPTVICPQDITVDCNSSTDVSVTGDALFSDNCDANPTIVINESAFSLDPCQSGFFRGWTVFDECGNTTSCAQSITIVDDTPPVITSCPVDVFICTYPDPNDSCFAYAKIGLPTATDDCKPNHLYK